MNSVRAFILSLICSCTVLRAQSDTLTPLKLIGDWTKYYVMDSSAYLQASDKDREDLRVYAKESFYAPFSEELAIYSDHTFDLDAQSPPDGFYSGEWNISGDTMIMRAPGHRTTSYYKVRMISSDRMEWKQVAEEYMGIRKPLTHYFYLQKAVPPVPVTRDMLLGKWTELCIPYVARYRGMPDSLKNMDTLKIIAYPRTSAREFHNDSTFSYYPNPMVDSMITGTWYLANDSLIMQDSSATEPEVMTHLRIVSRDQLEYAQTRPLTSGGYILVHYVYLEKYPR